MSVYFVHLRTSTKCNTLSPNVHIRIMLRPINVHGFPARNTKFFDIIVIPVNSSPFSIYHVLRALSPLPRISVETASFTRRNAGTTQANVRPEL
jgi:hypothetical protein